MEQPRNVMHIAYHMRALHPMHIFLTPGNHQPTIYSVNYCWLTAFVRDARYKYINYIENL